MLGVCFFNLHNYKIFFSWWELSQLRNKILLPIPVNKGYQSHQWLQPPPSEWVKWWVLWEHRKETNKQTKNPVICCCCSVAQSCVTHCDPMDCSTPWFPALHDLPEFAQTHTHWANDAIQPFHPLLPFLLLPSILPSNSETAATPNNDPRGSTGWQNTRYWPQVTEVHIKGIISMSPDSCIFPFKEKHYIL